MLRQLPNYLTYARIMAIPLFVGAFYVPAPTGPWLAFLLFLAAAITDFFDGYLARKLDATSALGRFLDPIADKLLIVAALVILVAVGKAPAVAAIIILLREVLIAGLREFLAGDQVVVPVSRLAKWKTATQLAAVTLLLLSGTGVAPELSTQLGIWLLWLAVILTVVTGYAYLRAGLARIVSADSGSA